MKLAQLRICNFRCFGSDLALVQRLPWRAVYAAKLICPASHFCSKAIGLV